MQLAQLIHTLGRNDVKLIGRDRFILFMIVFVFYIAVALRFGLPWANGYLAETGVLPSASVPLSLAAYYPLIVAYLVIFTGAMLAGSVFGFVLIDEKEDNTIKAMLVTPVPLSRYVLYRVSMPALGPAPLAFDFGFPVAYADTDDRQVFSFFMGFSR